VQAVRAGWPQPSGAPEEGAPLGRGSPALSERSSPGKASSKRTVRGRRGPRKRGSVSEAWVPGDLSGLVNIREEGDAQLLLHGPRICAQPTPPRGQQRKGGKSRGGRHSGEAWAESQNVKGVMVWQAGAGVRRAGQMVAGTGGHSQGADTR